MTSALQRTGGIMLVCQRRESIMRDLNAIREGWEEIEQIEARLASRMSPQESLRHWLRLQRTFELHLRETSELFGPERASALAELQNRLRRVARWQERHGDPGAVHPEHPRTAEES
jgi:hypothetical protein